MSPKIRLHKKITELSREKEMEYTIPEIHRNIENYGVYIDDQLVKKRLQWVQEWEQISIEHWPKRESGSFEMVKIIQQTPLFLLIFKPTNVVVEPGAGHMKDNLLDWLKTERFSNLFPVHRIDKDTQGLLLIAKSEQSQIFFQNQFRDRAVVKKYLAVVDNYVDKLWKTTHYQTRDKQNPTKQKLFWTENEASEYYSQYRSAKTIIKPKLYCPELNQSLVEIEIKTGRMHQIRVLCEALGFPLSEDKVYCMNMNKLSESAKIENGFLSNLPKEVDSEVFCKIQVDIFGKTKYCLLSNYLKLKTPDNGILEAEWKTLP